MSRIVTALYDTVPQAELALAHLSSEVGVEEGEIVDRSIAGRTKFAKVRLDPEERAACERELASGGYLLIARVAGDADPDRIVQLLQDVPIDGLGKATEGAPAATTGRAEGFRVEDPKAAQTAASPPPKPSAPSFARPPAAAAAPAAKPPMPQSEGFWVEDPKTANAPPAPAATTAAPSAQPASQQTEVAEERIPIVEEELRIGKREVLRGGARVHANIAERPVREEVELESEHTTIERRASGRKLTEEELEEGGLLRERMIEISEMREEAVVSKEAFVREELVVKKTIERRTEVIEDSVRHTEIETERLPGAEGRPALAGLAGTQGERR